MKITKKITHEIIFEDDSNMMKNCVINAILSGANLRGTNLSCSDLRGADLRGANLHDADLHGTNLCGANLCGANLHDADLRGANLRGANLRGADLRGANLSGANLRGANLRGANLHGTNIGYADLHGANLGGAKDIPFFPLSCPSDGEFIGWKKVSDKLVRLLIPSDAKRSSSTSNKCRCDKAKVLEITDLDGNNPITSVINNNYINTQYVVGEMVFPDSFDENRWNECSHGIHFFINKQEAINY